MKQGRGINDINKSIDREEGCNISGTFFLHFLANNFHITYSNPMMMARIVQMRGGDYTFELPHTINSLTYGPLSSTSSYEKEYNLEGFNTL